MGVNGKKLKITLISIAVGIGLLGIVFGVVMMILCGGSYMANSAALTALKSDETVTVTQDESGDSIVFTPDGEPKAGFVFYPGGKVENLAYAPLMHELAERDVLCVLTKMPFDLAVFGVNTADGIPEQYPEVEHWYIGGHSLGGSMAASYVAGHATDYDGLALLAAYSTEDLTNTDLKIVSLYGTEDKVLNMEKYAENRDNLPENTVEKVMEGANHAGFGSYGEQEGDSTAKISAEAQTEAAADILAQEFTAA